MASAGPAHHSYDLDPTQKLLVTVGVIAGMLMQVLDTTIANVALPHMQESLGATRDTISWVLTSYIVASAIAIPITGWLSDRMGRKPLFIWSVSAFTVASLLCAIATSLEEIVIFRALQGVAGAFLVPLAQSTMLDINPPEKHARAMAVFGMGVMIGPILGPVVGGYLTDNYNWRWVFLINLPVGVLAAALMFYGLPDTQKVRRPFDLFGFTLIALALGGLQLMLDRGEQNDWFSSWETIIELGVTIAGTWMFLVHMVTSQRPIFDPPIFRDRNFVASLVFMGITGVMLLAGLALLPPLLQSLFGYSVLQSGFLTAPRGIGTLVSMLIVGRLLGKVDARLIILLGTCLMAISLWQMSGFSLEMDSRPIIVSGVIQGFALGCIFVPLNTLAFGTLDPRYRTTGAALLNLSRNVGGSIGISVVTVLLARNAQISHSDLAAHITPYSIPQFLTNVVNAAPGVTDMAVAMVDAEVNRQALMIAYIDDFRLMMIISLCSIPLILLLRRARGAGGPAVMD